MSTITERVAAGAALLDEHKPGWWQHTDLGRLNIGSSCDCMFGQTFGGYLKGLTLFHEEWHVGAPDSDYGFFWYGRADDDRENEIEALNAEWRRVIEQRRAAS